MTPAGRGTTGSTHSTCVRTQGGEAMTKVGLAPLAIPVTVIDRQDRIAAVRGFFLQNVRVGKQPARGPNDNCGLRFAVVGRGTAPRDGHCLADTAERNPRCTGWLGFWERSRARDSGKRSAGQQPAGVGAAPAVPRRRGADAAEDCRARLLEPASWSPPPLPRAATAGHAGRVRSPEDDGSLRPGGAEERASSSLEGTLQHAGPHSQGLAPREEVAQARSVFPPAVPASPVMRRSPETATPPQAGTWEARRPTQSVSASPDYLGGWNGLEKAREAMALLPNGRGARNVLCSQTASGCEHAGFPSSFCQGVA